MARLLITLSLLTGLLSHALAQTTGESPLQDLPLLKNGRLIQISSHDRTGGNADYVTIGNGATATLAEIEGPGVIVHMWVTISSPDPYFLRRLLLRITWDGEATPSVEVPIGDFFGTGFLYRQFVTPYIGMSSGGYYAYWPMPFNKSARIEVVNQTGKEVGSFYYHIAYRALDHALDPSVAYFHAQWRREKETTRGRNYTICEAKGRGHYVGTILNMQGYEGHLGFLEGDEMIYVDGEKEPSLYGTGTEDYFNSGWYFNKGEFAAPYHGLILKDDTLARIAAYRFHVPDAIPFTRSIRVTIEHGHANEEVADYSSTALWYQVEPHERFPDMPKAGSRIPLRYVLPKGGTEAESLVPLGEGIRWSVQDMSDFGADWSGVGQLRVDARRPADHFVLEIPVTERAYRGKLYYTRGPDYGNATLFSGGRKIGFLRGYGGQVLPGGELELDSLRAENGKLGIHVIVSGKDSASRGYAVGLDLFSLEPRRIYIPEWYCIGPFPNPQDSLNRRLGLDLQFPPEKEIDMTKMYLGVGGQEVRWLLKETPKNGRMDLYHYTPHELVVSYALTHVYAEEARNATLLLGTDDGAKVFLNGQEVHRVTGIRVAQPDQDRVVLPLQKGWNALLLKIENNLGGYNFYARFPDTGDAPRVSARRKL